MSETRDLDTRTDRLARRLMLGTPVARDSYFWARLRLDIAMHDAGRAVRRELTPAIVHLEHTMMRFADAVAKLRSHP